MAVAWGEREREEGTCDFITKQRCYDWLLLLEGERLKEGRKGCKDGNHAKNEATLMEHL